MDPQESCNTEKNTFGSKRAFLFKAAALVMFVTFLSRVIGYVREMVMAAYFGGSVTPEMDAYRVAIILPNLFRMLLADAAIASAFIPVFSSYLARDDEDGAWRMTNSLFSIILLVLSVITAAGMLFAPELISILAPGFVDKPEVFEMTVSMTRIMFPSVLIMALAGIVMGVLNSYEHFFAPAFSPVLWNLFIIGFIILGAKEMGVHSIAYGVMAGTVVQFIFQVPYLKQRIKRFRLRLDFKEPGVKEFSLLVLPVILSLATADINTIVDTRFASLLPQGSVADLGYAIRVWLLPLGIFAIAIATVLFPTFARLAECKQLDELKKAFAQGTRMVYLIVIPSALWFMLLCIPVVRLLFERGEFLPKDTLLTASALFYYSVGLVAAGELHIVNRAFFALKDTVTPLLVAVCLVIVNYFGDWFFMNYLPVFGKAIGLADRFAWLTYPHGGIALSTSVVTTLNYVVLLWILRKRLGGVEGRKTLAVTIKILAASAVFALVSFFGWRFLTGLLGTGSLPLLVSLGASSIIGLLLYFVLLKLFKVREFDVLIELFLEKLTRKK